MPTIKTPSGKIMDENNIKMLMDKIRICSDTGYMRYRVSNFIQVLSDGGRLLADPDGDLWIINPNADLSEWEPLKCALATAYVNTSDGVAKLCLPTGEGDKFWPIGEFRGSMFHHTKLGDIFEVCDHPDFPINCGVDNSVSEYGCSSFLFDVFMVVITGGLWFIWILIRTIWRRL
jgi:hypothetical protein